MSVEKGGTPYGQLELGLGEDEISPGQLQVWPSVMDRLRMIDPRYSNYGLWGLAGIAPEYLNNPADILMFVAEYTQEMMDLPSEDGRKDDVRAMAIAKANIGYFLGNYPLDIVTLWDEALEGVIGPMTGPFSAPEVAGATVLSFTDHEDLALFLKMGGLGGWINGVRGVADS